VHGPYRDNDPDETKPPSRVDELWGWTPPRGLARSAAKGRAHPPAPVPSTSDMLALYRAACDCVAAGAHAGATALLRRLILRETARTSRHAATREEAERLLATAETLLGLSKPGDRESNA
jgi:hypothetical protein